MNDKYLLKKIKDGQKEYLNEVITQYYDDIYRFCVYQTGNKEDSYDITQETFLKFIKYVDSYREHNLKGYLLTIARNLCRDYFRNRCVTECMEEMNETGEADQRIEQMDTAMMLCEYLQKIPEEQREVLVLRYYQEVKLGDISRILGVNLSTVKSRLRLGVRNLKKEMEV